MGHVPKYIYKCCAWLAGKHSHPQPDTGSGMAFLAAALLAGAAAASTDSIFQFTDLVKIDGTPISLAQFKGNVRKMRALLR